MVVNPKKSQEFILYGIESLLNILLDLTANAANKITQSNLTDFVSDEIRISEVDVKRLSKSLYQLKRRGYLEVIEDSVALTNKAKMKMVDRISSNMQDDNKYHLVSFDIPEVMKRNRNRFRSTLKRIGFVQIQKSLWVSKKEVGELVEIAAEENGVGKFIAYFVAEYSNIDRHISKITKRNNSK